MPSAVAEIGTHKCGPGQPLLVIAGPCVIESEELTLAIAVRLAELAERLPIQLIFKASFDKANRTSTDAFRGHGMERGLEILARIKAVTGLRLTTDIHESYQAPIVAEEAPAEEQAAEVPVEVPVEPEEPAEGDEPEVEEPQEAPVEPEVPVAVEESASEEEDRPSAA